MTADPHAPARFPSLVSDLPLTRSALEFASAHHEGQRREADSAPFILHPLEVAQLLRARGYGDEVIAAAALHDVVEDTDVEPAELEQRFGRTVARLVEVLTEPSSDGSIMSFHNFALPCRINSMAIATARQSRSDT